MNKVLDKESLYHYVDKKFWDWFTDNPDREIEDDLDVYDIIDNQKFVEDGHQKRIKSGLTLNKDFVVVPDSAYQSLIKWYPANMDV